MHNIINVWGYTEIEHNLRNAPRIMHSGFFVGGTWVPDSNYKWDTEYLTFIPDSKRKIFQIPLHGATANLR